MVPRCCLNRARKSGCSRAYIADESDARAGRRGMWRGDFVPPWDWRRGARLAGASAPSKEAAGGRCRSRAISAETAPASTMSPVGSSTIGPESTLRGASAGSALKARLGRRDGVDPSGRLGCGDVTRPPRDSSLPAHHRPQDQCVHWGSVPSLRSGCFQAKRGLLPHLPPCTRAPRAVSTPSEREARVRGEEALGSRESDAVSKLGLKPVLGLEFPVWRQPCGIAMRPQLLDPA